LYDFAPFLSLLVVAIWVEHKMTVLNEDVGVLSTVSPNLDSRVGATYLIIPVSYVVVGGSFDRLDCIVRNKANEALDNAIFVCTAFVPSQKIDKAYICGSDTQKEHLGGIMGPKA
jgi:hypothetical protein